MKNQFRLWHIFYATAVIAAAMSLGVAVIVGAGIWIGTCYAASVYRQSKRNRRSDMFALLPVTIVCLCCAGNLFLPDVGDVRPHARRIQGANNIRQLMLAMLNYESARGQFPLAAQTLDGKPAHSWRVAILPFIEQQALYNQYDFDEPWDGPNNRKLIDQIPEVYRSPGRDHGNKTQYKLIVGPDSLFDGNPPAFARILDGSSNTAALIEDAAHPVEWTRPEDITIDDAIEVFDKLDFETAPYQIDSTFKTEYSLGSFVRFDGSTGSVSASSSARELRKLFGIDNGIAEEDLQNNGPSSLHKAKPEAFIALGIFLLLMLYPLSWVFQKLPPESEAESISNQPAN